MWLRNWDNAFCAMFGLGENTSASFKDGYSALKFIGGNTYNLHENSSGTNYVISFPRRASNYSTSINSSNLSSSVYEINVGTGTTEETYDDYKMESPLTSASLTHVEYLFESLGYDEETQTWGKKVTRAFRNATEEQLTITEIGIYMGMSTTSSGTAMVYHEILNEPIVVEPDQKFSVSIPMYAQMLHHPNLA